MSTEQVCQRCRRVCFSQQQFENHECFDMAAKIESEVRLAATAPANVPFQNWLGEYHRKQGVSPYVQAQEVVNLDDMGIGFASAQDSCGPMAAGGKGGDGVSVEGSGEDAATSTRSESQQNCAGLGAGWGTQPAGINLEAAILAQTRMLLSRSLAYVGLQDLKCARQLAVEIRDHLEAVDAYAMAKGIAWDVAEAMVNLMGTAKA